MSEINLTTIRFFLHIAIGALQMILDLIAKIDPDAKNNKIFITVQDVVNVLKSLDI